MPADILAVSLHANPENGLVFSHILHTVIREKERRRGFKIPHKHMRHKTTTIMAAMLAAAGTAAMTPGYVFAAEKISRVSVDFTIEGYDEYGYPEITAETPSSAHYSCGSADLESAYADDGSEEEGNAEKAKTAAEENYVIELSAEDGYAFQLTKADQVKLNGAGARYVKASRLDNGTTLRLTFQLTQLEDVCSPAEQAVWHEDGTASWDPAYNAVRYKLILSRDSGGSKAYYTGGTSYDFKPVMLRKGSYSLKVCPLSRSGYQAGHADAGSFSVTKEMAEAYSEAYGVETETRKLDGASGDGPGSVEVICKNTGWKQDSTGWWYQNEDGSYLQYDWAELNGDWYFFGSDGYMVTDRAVRWGNDSYYMGPDGRMAVNQEIPDGRRAGADGILTGTVRSEYIEQAASNGEMEDHYSNHEPASSQEDNSAHGPASGQT